MKTIKVSATLLLLVMLAFTSNLAMAQDKTPNKTPDKASVDKAKSGALQISSFDAGKALTDDDINFLNLVTEAGKTRGKEAPKVCYINKTKYVAGQKISATDATAISAKVVAYNKAHKLEAAKAPAGAKPRGGECYYYCEYDYYGNYICYWYCY